MAAYGVYIIGRVKLDVFPEFAPPRIIIQTEAPGLSAEEVEALVTRPVRDGRSWCNGAVAKVPAHVAMPRCIESYRY